MEVLFHKYFDIRMWREMGGKERGGKVRKREEKLIN
jgi:hypothetical protein